MAKINIPQANNQGSMGRRLFAMAAPIVGGALGGPAGAAAGALVGGKLGGASTQDAVLNAAQAGINAKSDTPAARRATAAGQNPQVAVSEGLSVLSTLPPEHPMRQELTAPLVKAQFAAKGMKPY